MAISLLACLLLASCTSLVQGSATSVPGSVSATPPGTSSARPSSARPSAQPGTPGERIDPCLVASRVQGKLKLTKEGQKEDPQLSTCQFSGPSISQQDTRPAYVVILGVAYDGGVSSVQAKQGQVFREMDINGRKMNMLAPVGESKACRISLDLSSTSRWIVHLLGTVGNTLEKDYMCPDAGLIAEAIEPELPPVLR
ncbi:DUF3558 family protein [Allokutzneria sp. NRRL B-24872]|uniref:DUF3558 family protein n=1 Tax=Allokutzneria sp. NRRL B-24872 TaxID=1137961 RepID=UPI00143D56E0|nr:DUF3558 family protein [Allokutzneria sp. NRRL B-24872]